MNLFHRLRRFPFHNHFPFILILSIAIFLRFYNFPNRISMGPDSARDAIVSLEGARALQFPLTGPWYWMQLILARLFLPTNYVPWPVLGANGHGDVRDWASP